MVDLARGRPWRRVLLAGFGPVVAIGAVGVAAALAPTQAAVADEAGDLEPCAANFGTGEEVGVPIYVTLDGVPIASNTAGLTLAAHGDTEAAACLVVLGLPEALAGVEDLFVQAGLSAAAARHPTILFAMTDLRDFNQLRVESVPAGTELIWSLGPTEHPDNRGRFWFGGHRSQIPPGTDRDETRDNAVIAFQDAIENPFADGDGGRAEVVEKFANVGLGPDYFAYAVHVMRYNVPLPCAAQTEPWYDFLATPTADFLTSENLPGCVGASEAEVELSHRFGHLAGFRWDEDAYRPPLAGYPAVIHIELRTLPTAAPRAEPTFSGMAPLTPRVVSSGATVRTLAPGTPPSPQTPVGLTITTAAAGEVSVTPALRDASAPAPGGYAVLGVSFAIEAPPASAEQPHVFAFALDASLLEDADGPVVPMRDGVAVADCLDPDGTAATPDPCVASRVLDADGDLHLEVRTSHASDWTFAATCPTATFTDVVRGAPGVADLDCLVAAGVVAGYADGRFGREETLRRDQAASLLARTMTASGHALAPGTPSFSDVAGGTHAAAVDTLAGAGVVVGTGDGRFDPGAPILRGQFATMALRAAEVSGRAAASAGDPDTAGTTHGAAAERLAELGLPLGEEGAPFEPGAPLRRFDAAVFLNRLMAWLATP